MKDIGVVRSVVIAGGVAVLGLALVIGAAASGAFATKPKPTSTITPSPTATLDMVNFYNVHGQVFDADSGLPIAGVCVVIGPLGCQANMAHSDVTGKFLVQLPRQVIVAYDFHFVKAGYQQVDYHLVVNDDLDIPVRMPKVP